jgi:hypothetical protein
LEKTEANFFSCASSSFFDLFSIGFAGDESVRSIGLVTGKGSSGVGKREGCFFFEGDLPSPFFAANDRAACFKKQTISYEFDETIS